MARKANFREDDFDDCPNVGQNRDEMDKNVPPVVSKKLNHKHMSGSKPGAVPPRPWKNKTRQAPNKADATWELDYKFDTGPDQA